MKTRHWVMLIKFLAVSVPLTWLWMTWGKQAYGELFVDLARPIYELLGIRTIRPNGVRDRFINYLPFVILMLLTPGISLLRRSLGTLVGCVIIFFMQVGFSLATAWGPRGRAGGMTHEGFESSFPAYLLSDSFPFILWVIVCHRFVFDMLSRAVERGSAVSAPRDP